MMNLEMRMRMLGSIPLAAALLLASALLAPTSASAQAEPLPQPGARVRAAPPSSTLLRDWTAGTLLAAEGDSLVGSLGGLSGAAVGVATRLLQSGERGRTVNPGAPRADVRVRGDGGVAVGMPVDF